MSQQERLPYEIKCGKCGNADLNQIRYVESIDCWRSIDSVGENKLRITSAYNIGEGYDDGSRPRFECVTCAHSWVVPVWVRKNIEWV